MIFKVLIGGPSNGRKAAVPTPRTESASIAAGRNLASVLTKLRTERASLQHELRERRQRHADVLLDAEMGDAAAIVERDSFATEELRIETRLKQIEPTIAELTRRFDAEKPSRFVDHQRLAFRRIRPLMPKRVELGQKADDLVAQLGLCITALRIGHDAALASLRPHLRESDMWAIEGDPKRLARTVVGRLLMACGFDTYSLQEITGSG